jgi:hypothetical protein
MTVLKLSVKSPGEMRVLSGPVYGTTASSCPFDRELLICVWQMCDGGRTYVAQQHMIH